MVLTLAASGWWGPPCQAKLFGTQGRVSEMCQVAKLGATAGNLLS